MFGKNWGPLLGYSFRDPLGCISEELTISNIHQIYPNPASFDTDSLQKLYNQEIYLSLELFHSRSSALWSEVFYLHWWITILFISNDSRHNIHNIIVDHNKGTEETYFLLSLLVLIENDILFALIWFEHLFIILFEKIIQHCLNHIKLKFIWKR